MELVPMLIGLCGFKGSGKDTVADYLVESFGFVKIQNADPIRRALAAMFEIDIATFTDVNVKELPLPELKDHSPRFLQQTLGTEWGRTIDPDLWVWLAQQKINKYYTSGVRHLVVSDVRFENEARAIKARGGVVWHVERPGIVRTDGHPSEKGLPPEFIDLAIHNDGTKAMLYTKVGVNLDALDRKIRRSPVTSPSF